MDFPNLRRQAEIALNRFSGFNASQRLETQRIANMVSPQIDIAKMIPRMDMSEFTKDTMAQTDTNTLTNALSTMTDQRQLIADTINSIEAQFVPIEDLSQYMPKRLFDVLPQLNPRAFMPSDDIKLALARYVEELQKGEDGRAVLAAIGETYITAVVSATEFSDLASEDQETQRKEFDERAATWLADEQVQAELREAIAASEIIKPRWRFIAVALQSHYDGDYISSVPVLLAQLEGMYADLLILKQLVVRQDGRLYELDPDTNTVKLDRNERPVKVPGLHRIIELSGFVWVPEWHPARQCSRLRYGTNFIQAHILGLCHRERVQRSRARNQINRG